MKMGRSPIVKSNPTYHWMLSKVFATPDSFREWYYLRKEEYREYSVSINCTGVFDEFEELEQPREYPVLARIQFGGLHAHTDYTYQNDIMELLGLPGMQFTNNSATPGRWSTWIAPVPAMPVPEPELIPAGDNWKEKWEDRAL